MKQKLYIILGIILGIIITIPFIALAIPITVPSAPSSGYFLQSTTTGQYLPVSLTAGSNITISTSTTNITINSTGGGGSGSVSTSTPLVSGQVDFSTGVSTIGNDASFLFDSILKKLTVTNATTTSASFTDASTTSFIINGQVFTNLLGTGLSLVGGALTNNGVISLGNGTGTTCSGTNPGTCNVNTTQNITTLSNLATNGLVYTGSGNGTLNVLATSTLTGSGLISVTGGAYVPGGTPIVVSCSTCGTGNVGFGFNPLVTNFNVAGVSTTTVVNFTNGFNASSTSNIANLQVQNINGANTNLVIQASTNQTTGNLLTLNRNDGVELASFNTTGTGTFKSYQIASEQGNAYALNAADFYQDSAMGIRWSGNATDYSSGIDTGLNRNAAGVVEFNNGTTGTLADFTARSASTTGQTVLATTNGRVGIGTTSPYALLSVGNTSGIGFTTATSTFNSTGGINLQSGGCFAISGGCIGGGTVTSVATNATLTGGPITTTGTLGINLATANAWTATASTTFTNAVGIGTTSPTTLFSVDLASSTTGTVQGTPFGFLMGMVINAVRYMVLSFDYWGHEFFSGPAPSISSCGTGSPSVVGNDNVMVITTGTGAPTECKLLFAHTWGATAPVCTITDQSVSLVSTDASTTPTTLNIGLSAGLTSGTVGVHCFGYR